MSRRGNRNAVAHGHTGMKDGKVWKSLTYQSWAAMNDRCYREQHKWFKAYGGRGIAVCERWRRGAPNAFANFLTDMGERPSKEITLDRKDVDGDYTPDNCRWADKSTQRQNIRTTTKDHNSPLMKEDDYAAF